MRLIAKSGKNNFIYDAGDNWYHSWHNDYEKKDKEKYVSKTKNPMYPLAATAKWGFEAVDKEYLHVLWKGGLKAVEEYVKNNP